jgi:subtilisin family serine protease
MARRVVIKLASELERGFVAQEIDAARLLGGRWERLAAAYPGVRIEPYFRNLTESERRTLTERSRTAERGGMRRFSYLAIECPPGVEPGEIARALREAPEVEIAYVEQPTPPPLNPSDDPRSANQGYLNAAPGGINARSVWDSADGSGVGVVDLEQGWTLNHEDLAAAGITIISGVSNAYHGHGTAVLGQLVGVDNTIGGIGIAPAATTRVVSQWRTATIYNTAEAILSAVAAMNTGDVLLLEAQSDYGTGTRLFPVEVEQAAFDAIELATSQGIVVVEAAGNGNEDLDQFQDVLGRRILNRSSQDFRDSGAIMVGAASSATPHQRLYFSNHGSRIDCFAWGENIDTCGDGWMGTATNAYTTSFGGTSGASPIVTGAAVLFQSLRIKQGLARYDPATMRALLANANNTPSANPAVDRIGVMPDLLSIRFGHINFHRWAAVVWILFGVIQDGGGIVIKPGSGPIPIDPWGPLNLLAADKRDVLAALAMTELAELLTDSSSRLEARKAGFRAIQRATRNLEKSI